MFSTIFFGMIIGSWEEPAMLRRILYPCPISQCMWEWVSEGALPNNSLKRCVRMYFRHISHVYSGFFLLCRHVGRESFEGKRERGQNLPKFIAISIDYYYYYFWWWGGWLVLFMLVSAGFVWFRSVSFGFYRFHFVSFWFRFVLYWEPSKSFINLLSNCILLLRLIDTGHCFLYLLKMVLQSEGDRYNENRGLISPLLYTYRSTCTCSSVKSK
jgi:hypothetical protein